LYDEPVVSVTVFVGSSATASIDACRAAARALRQGMLRPRFHPWKTVAAWPFPRKSPAPALASGANHAAAG